VFPPRSASQLDPVVAHIFASDTFDAIINVRPARGSIAREVVEDDVPMVVISQVPCASEIAGIDAKWLAVVFGSELEEEVAPRTGADDKPELAGRLYNGVAATVFDEKSVDDGTTILKSDGGH